MLIVRERQDFAFWAGEASDFVSVMTETAEFLAELPEAQRAAAIAALQEEPPSIDTEFQRRPAPPEAFVASALAAYERALEPKKLALLGGGHFEAYVEAFDEASGAARDWFVEHLFGR